MAKNEEQKPAEQKDLPGIGDLPIDDLREQIEAWKKKYGSVHHVTAAFGDQEFNGVFRVPDEKDLESARREELKGLEQNRELCRRTVLYPEPMAFNDLVMKNWAFCTPISEKLLELTNLTTKAKVKKL